MTSPEPRAPAPTPDKWDSDTAQLAGFLEVRARPAAQLRRGDTGVPRACSSSSPRQGPSPARPPGVLAWPSCCHSRPSLLDASVYLAPEQARSHLASVAPRGAHSRCALSAEGDQGNSETGRGPSSACPGPHVAFIAGGSAYPLGLSSQLRRMVGEPVTCPRATAASARVQGWFGFIEEGRDLPTCSQ